MFCVILYFHLFSYPITVFCFLLYFSLILFLYLIIFVSFSSRRSLLLPLSNSLDFFFKFSHLLNFYFVFLSVFLSASTNLSVILSFLFSLSFRFFLSFSCDFRIHFFFMVVWKFLRVQRDATSKMTQRKINSMFFKQILSFPENN